MINIPNIVRDWLEQYHKNLGKKDEPLLNQFVRYSFLFFLISLLCWYIYNGFFFYSKEYAVRKEVAKCPFL